MFYAETKLLYFLHLHELGPCVYIKLKNMLPVLEFHEILVYIFSRYMDSLYVEMVSWQRPQYVKILIPF